MRFIVRRFGIMATRSSIKLQLAQCTILPSALESEVEGNMSKVGDDH